MVLVCPLLLNSAGKQPYQKSLQKRHTHTNNENRIQPKGTVTALINKRGMARMIISLISDTELQYSYSLQLQLQ